TTTGTVTVNPTADRAPIDAALSRVVGAFVDPRLDTSGPKQGKEPDQDSPVGIAQALNIDRGDAGALNDAITNECFGGDASPFNRSTLEQILGESACARTVKLDAARTASQMKAVVQRQAQSYEGVIRAMRNAGGIRHLVIVTDGVALSQD